MTQQKVVVIDILDDSFFDIVEIYKDLASRVGFSRDCLVKVDGIRSIQDVKFIDCLAGIIISGSIHNFSDLPWSGWFDSLLAIIREYHR
ncbi:MAG: hypothetical protein AAB482_00050 [Patescibacteria group bacterium]